MTRLRTLMALWMLVMISALAVVYTSHVCRQLYTELARLQQTENNLQVIWGQYLLEQMEQFFFGDNAAMPEGWAPEGQPGAKGGGGGAKGGGASRRK